MSVLFPKVNKAPEWNWRPIYYDPKKDEMDAKLKKLQEQRKEAEEHKTPEGYTPTLHRGSFRQAHEENQSMVQKAQRQSKMTFWLALLAMLVFALVCLSKYTAL